jgi:3-isopropylmalate dehydratase small subunit
VYGPAHQHTDEISPAGARALPFRSNIPKLAMFSCTQIDESYPERAQQAEGTGHIVVGGENYGQGSSRERAAIAPRYLGLRAVIAKSFARIHWLNLANYGVLALEFENPGDYDTIDQGDTLRIQHLRDALANKDTLQVDNLTKKSTLTVRPSCCSSPAATTTPFPSQPPPHNNHARRQTPPPQVSSRYHPMNVHSQASNQFQW